MALTSGSKILIDDVNDAIKAFSVSGKTVTFTRLDGTTGTFTTQDTNTTYSAGTGLSLSSNTFSLATVTTSGGTAGPTANATPSYGATFTVPQVNYDAYGRVTGHTNRTVKIPAAPSGGSANMLKGVAMALTSKGPNYFQFGGFSFPGNIGQFTFPSGGTWRYAKITNTGGEVGDVAGGTTKTWGTPDYTIVIAIKIA